MIEQYRKLAEQMTRAGHRLYARGLVAGLYGCISARLGDGLMMITPRGVPLSDLSTDALCIMDESGKWLAGGKAPGQAQTHFEIYRKRPDVMVILHAWPPHALALALKRSALDFSEIMPGLGQIAVVKPSAENDIALHVVDTSLALLPPHGTFALADTVMDALFAMETLEHAARIFLCSG